MAQQEGTTLIFKSLAKTRDVLKSLPMANGRSQKEAGSNESIDRVELGYE